MRTKTNLFCVAVVVHLVFLHTSQAQSKPVWLERMEVVELPGTNIETLDIETDKGTIDVRAAEENSAAIVVKITMRGGAHTPEEAQVCLNSMDLAADKRGSIMKLRLDWPGERESHWQHAFSYEIIAPARLSVDAEARDGGIRIESMNGALKLRSHDGPIVVLGGTGKLYAKTHTGDIEISTASAEVDVKAHDGYVDVEMTYAGRVEGEIDAHNGSIKVDLDESTSTELKVKASPGSIRNELLLHDLEKEQDGARETLSGRLGKGGKQLTVTARHGNVTLRKAGSS